MCSISFGSVAVTVSSSIRQCVRLSGPAVLSVHHSRPCRNHPLDGDKRAPVAGDGDFQPAVDLLRRGIRSQRNLVHIDEMLAQRFEVDLSVRILIV